MEKELYKKLQDYVDFGKVDANILTIFKTGSAALFGGFFGAVIRDLSAENPEYVFWHIAPSVVFLLLALWLEWRKLQKDKLFPVTILEHLTGMQEASALRKSNERKSKINEYLNRSIRSLNNATCPVSYGQDNNSLCQSDLSNGLSNVLSDFISKPHYIFDIDRSVFTIGVYVNKVLNNPYMGTAPTPQMFYFRNELLTQSQTPAGLSHAPQNEDTDHLAVRLALTECMQSGNYICKKIALTTGEHTIICSPIPNVCDGCPADGIIFGIYEGGECCPADTKGILLLFGQIVSNWISKYNDCVKRDYDRRNPAGAFPVGHYPPTPVPASRHN